MMGRERGSALPNLEQRLTAFEEAFSSADPHVRDLLLGIRDAVIQTRRELDRIHISSLPHPTGVLPICFDCGERDLDVIYTSKRNRCQLCAQCFHRREKRGAARTGTARPERSETPLSQPQ